MKTGIIGLGLIGGSLFKVLKDQKDIELFLVSSNRETQKEVRNTSNAIVNSDINLISSCEIIFVCSPISKTQEILDRLENIVNKNTIVVDVASVKTFVGKKERPYKLIGSHPMAGTENQGFQSSFKELFEGAKWVITPFCNIEEKDIEVLKSIIKKSGATPILANAKEHDKAVALISHMPMIVSQALFNAVKDNELALTLASSGFRDMTRLAMSNTQMAKDMVEFNSKNIELSIDTLVESLNELKNNYPKLIEEIKEQRSKMYSKEGKNIFKGKG